MSILADLGDTSHGFLGPFPARKALAGQKVSAWSWEVPCPGAKGVCVRERC